MRRILLLVPILFFLAAEVASAENKYMGAARCMSCHLSQFEEWKDSGHAHILGKPNDGDVLLPEGYSRKNISYMIGGYRWKILFLDKDGYVITSAPGGRGTTQYNLKSKRWVGDTLIFQYLRVP